MKPLKSGDEERFMVARRDIPIVNGELEYLKEVLRLVMLKVGIRANNIPDDSEKAILIEHILTNYGNHTPQEIKLAFDMAIGGKLDLDEKDVTAYENFSCLYFSKIMNAYRKWASQTHNQFKKDYPKMIEEKKTLSDEEKAEWICDWKSMDEVNIGLIPLLFYEFLDTKKIINLTAKQKNKYLELAVKQVKSKLLEDIAIIKNNDPYVAYNSFENMEKSGFTGELKGRVLNQAKRLIVFDYLKDKL